MMGSATSSGAEKGDTTVETEEQFNIEVDYTEAEEKKLIRKIDLFILPTLWIMYLLSYMDRTNIGNAKIAGLQQDLHLSSSQYSMSLIAFFITYVIFEVPSNMLLCNSKPSIYLPFIMILWGTATCCMSAVKNYQQLVALRVLVGVLEAGFAPGVLLIISSWYKRSEQSKRFAIYLSASIMSGAFGGLLGGAITKQLEGVHGIRGWRWLFIIEGAATASWAIIAHFILLDFPTTTPRLSEREKYVAVRRLQTESITAKIPETAEPSHLRALREAFKNWRLWLFTVGYMVIVGSSTIQYFFPTLVEGLGYTSYKAQYMTVPIYAAAFSTTLLTGYFCDRIPRHRGLVVASWLLLATACTITVCAVYNHQARYVLLVFTASGLWAGNALSLSFAASSFGSVRQEVRAVSLAFINAMGNLAQIYGAFLFPAQQAPKYLMGFEVISVMAALGVCVYAVGHLLVNRYPL